MLLKLKQDVMIKVFFQIVTIYYYRLYLVCSDDIVLLES